MMAQGLRKWWLNGLAATAMLAALAAPLAAQGIGGGEVELDPDNPFVVGQWAGPWDFGAVINPVAGKQQWDEIAHCILLPDKTNTGRTRVLFICRRNEVADEQPPVWPLPSAYIWDPSEPTELQAVPFDPDPANIDNLSEDPFCGGHSFTPEGDVVFFGGVDAKKEVETPYIWGNKAVYVFVNDPAGYYWVRLGTMSRERWYPTATALNDGSILVTGHANLPAYPLPSADTYDRGTVTYAGSVPTGIVWQPLVAAETNGVHENLDLVGGNCSSSVSIGVGEFPRQHLLLSGQVFQGGRDVNLDPLVNKVNGYLDLLACATSPVQHRWIRGPTTGNFPQQAERGDDLLTDLSGASGSIEYVYGLGGANRYLTDLSNEVVRIVNPNPATATWVDDDVVAPDLNANVYDGNYPILLDGSILRVGGYGYDGVPMVYPARKQPELFQPSGIFATPAANWKLMKEELYERRYHSTAVTLPSGQVVSAGGNDTEVGGEAPEPSWWSAELFSPPYLFKGPRPRILTMPVSVSLGTVIQFTVALRTASVDGEFRVALLAPGAATHAFDQNQHYIKLKLFAPVDPNSNPDGATTIQVDAPADASVPRGWYMLTVVNSVGVPSAAKWIKVTAP